MSNLESEYFERRRRQALEAAERADDPGIAATHRQFAELYGKAAAGTRPGTQPVLRAD
ncbi:hypothetical protein P1X14_15940 [Sphingomonas sp. AOB5]|uniref:hypothetical protein n=1 Tax=Sphingomonas sp. AOB5 TaxID=3034017 RepID=UPI0023F85C69|nr:hypothetical protein [Sphingomonas sp. AOB5]MDF7776749.1 hypothetical protein [Sphingomonas sp. AOB5]